MNILEEGGGGDMGWGIKLISLIPVLNAKLTSKMIFDIKMNSWNGEWKINLKDICSHMIGES